MFKTGLSIDGVFTELNTNYFNYSHINYYSEPPDFYPILKEIINCRHKFVHEFDIKTKYESNEIDEMIDYIIDFILAFDNMWTSHTDWSKL